MVDTLLEEKLLEEYDYVIGVDEVGRGAFAGPLCVAAFLLSKDDLKKIKGEKEFLKVNDSKKVTKKNREKLSLLLKQYKYEVVLKDNTYIDTFGLTKALVDAIEEAVEKLITKDKKVIIILDGNFKETFSFSYKSIIDGDAKHFTIASASIIAKVYRDNLMNELSKEFSGYSFEKNVGYGTKNHFEALKKLGVTKIHRKSFEPIKRLLDH